MDSSELKLMSQMSYKELVDHLLNKYGPAEHFYFRTTALSSVNPKVSRSTEGLFCHHIDEDKAIKLSSISNAKKNPIEYQNADRLVYCNLIEHLLLHIKITLEPRHPDANPNEDVGIGGIKFITDIINDYYNGYEFKKDYLITATKVIENNLEDYTAILRTFIRELMMRRGPKQVRLNFVRWLSKKSLDRKEENIIFDRLVTPDEQDLIPEEELKQLADQARNGDVTSQIKLADLYRIGNNIKQNRKLSFYYFDKAAEQGSAYAIIMLGKYYEKGFGVEKDIGKSFEYFMTAAEADIEQGMYEVGLLYLHGKGVEPNKEEAFKWFTKAAHKGFAPAQVEVGRHFKEQRKTKKNLEESRKWFELAAEQNNADALLEVALMYLNGRGVEVDRDKAKHYLIESIKQGNGYAVLHLHSHFGE